MEKISNEQIMRTIRLFLTIKQNEDDFFMNCTFNELINKIQEYWDNPISDN